MQFNQGHLTDRHFLLSHYSVLYRVLLSLFVHTGVLATAGGVVKDQAEDMSVKQRLVLAGGSALSGASEMVDIAGAMEVGGEHLSISQWAPLSMQNNYYAGSTAEGVADLEHDSDVQKIAGGVSKIAESWQDDGKKTRSSI